MKLGRTGSYCVPVSLCWRVVGHLQLWRGENLFPIRIVENHGKSSVAVPGSATIRGPVKCRGVLPTVIPSSG